MRGSRREIAAQRRRDDSPSRLHDAQARAAMSAPMSVQETMSRLGSDRGSGQSHIEIEMADRSGAHHDSRDRDGDRDRDQIAVAVEERNRYYISDSEDDGDSNDSGP